MALVEILDVALTELDAEQLRGRNIEVPKAESRIDSDTILIIGWVLGRSSLAPTVEVVHDGTVLQGAELDVQRPDVAAAFPEVPGAEQSGFRTRVAVPNLGEFELLVRAVLQDESTASLGSIRGRQDGIGEATESGSSVQGPSGPKVEERSSSSEGFFRRLFGRGGG
jgi:O-antigen biosynthesis protein